MLGALLIMALLAAFPARDARADIKEACASAYEQGQLLRRDGKLVLARAQLAICQQACPAELVSDCQRWTGEIDATSPSVILEARDKNGHRLSDVRVTLDGKPFVERLDGAAAMVDPGRHTFRFEIGGAAAREETLDLRAGEKARLVSLVFPDVIAPPPPPPAIQPPALPRREPPPGAAPGVPPATYVLAAAGVVGLGAGATLGIKGHVERSELESECAPYCKRADVDAIRREWVIGGIAAAAGAALLGVALGLLLVKPGPAAPASRALVLRPGRGGRAASLGVSF
jgi:hypothetical protein